jgi:hypothetical protein
MTEVKISVEPFLALDPSEFVKWCADSGIDDDAWDFIQSEDLNNETSETFTFSHECDAIAFRLKFGI